MQDAGQGFYGNGERKDFDLTLFINNELDPTTADKLEMLPNFVWQSDLSGVGDDGAEHGEKRQGALCPILTKLLSWAGCLYRA